jgi:hypothetical protein
MKILFFFNFNNSKECTLILKFVAKTTDSIRYAILVDFKFPKKSKNNSILYLILKS